MEQTSEFTVHFQKHPDPKNGIQQLIARRVEKVVLRGDGTDFSSEIAALKQAGITVEDLTDKR
jgi:hypothetical protein